MTTSEVQQEISAEIKKRIALKEAKYEERFNGPTQQTKKRWSKKIVQQVEQEKAQLTFNFIGNI
jgi:hypothetical protein